MDVSVIWSPYKCNFIEEDANSPKPTRQLKVDKEFWLSVHMLPLFEMYFLHI
jgi:hypothetical protein